MSENQADIAELLQKRDKLKDNLTSLERHSNDFLAHPNADFELFDIHGRLEKHKPILDHFQEIQDTLDSFTTDSTTEIANDEERKSFENRYHAINGSGVIDSGNSHHFFLDPNFPKLGLPSFSRTFDTWLSFRDIFTSMVHENSEVPPIFKFLYLKSCVTSEIKEVRDSRQSSEENYPIAWKLLINRYDNRKFIAENHVKVLFDIPSVSKKFSVRLLLNNVLKHTRALRALNQPIEQWDLVLIHVFKLKL